MPEIRVYIEVDALATRTVQQWADIRAQMLLRPMFQWIQDRGQQRNQPHCVITAQRFSVNPVRRYVIVKFEIHISDEDAAKTRIDQLCATRGIVQATYRLKIQALLQAELLEAVTAAGYVITPALTVRGFGERMTAISEFHAWLATVSATWETAL